MKIVTLVPGDGIGPEIVDAVRELFVGADVPIKWELQEAGLSTFEKSGQALPDSVIESIRRNKIALKGPTATPSGKGHRSINVQIRQTFELFANVRPIKSIPGVKCIYDDVDLIIVRENSEDLYKGIEYQITPDIAHGIKLVTRAASERIGRHAFELARKLGRKKVSIVHKANIMKYTDGLFLEAIRHVAKDYADIECDDYIVDNCCMQLVTKPQQFDVIVTQNLYGDILSDLTSGLVGGLGVASGANIGENLAVFEAVHGSAPDIAGRGLANPTALMLSATSMLEYMDMKDLAQRIKAAILKTLTKVETRTCDLGGSMSTSQFTQAVINNL